MAPETELTLNGLLITGGRLRVSSRRVPSGPVSCDSRHCTLVPGLSLTREGEPVSPSVPVVGDRAGGTTIEIDHCLLGGIRAVDNTEVSMTNTLVDATSPTGVAYAALDGQGRAGC